MNDLAIYTHATSGGMKSLRRLLWSAFYCIRPQTLNAPLAAIKSQRVNINFCTYLKYPSVQAKAVWADQKQTVKLK